MCFQLWPHTRGLITEPCWHRNLRTRRTRARHTISIAKLGAAVTKPRLAVAQQLLLDHNGTRGTAVESMANDDFLAAGSRKLAPNDWFCPWCSKKGAYVFAFAKRPCKWCKKDRPQKFTLFKDTKIGKAL